MTDSISHIMTPDGSIRAVMVDARQTVGGVIQAQSPGNASEALGELVMGALLVQESMAPDQRLQMTLRLPTGALYADALTQGRARGWVSTRLSDISGGQLQVARVLESGQLHEGTIDAWGSTSEILTNYMMTSEQTTSTVGVSCRVEDDAVLHARGFMIQLLPDPDPGSLAFVTLSLEQLVINWYDFDDQELAHAILGPGVVHLSRSDVSFGCTCSEATVLNALIAAGQDEVADMIAQNKPVEVTCEYCKTSYEVTVPQLKSLFR
ncbi:MAG: Hsp33 family molecular chaperone HslO [bacterium]